MRLEGGMACVLLGVIAAPAHAGLAGGSHHARPDGDGLIWSTELHLDNRDTIELAHPVAISDVRDLIGATAEAEQDEIVRLIPSGMRVHLETVQLDRSSLRAPLILAPSALQQVSVEDLRFEAGASANVVPRVGWAGTSGVETRDRRAMLEVLDKGARRRRAGAVVMRVDTRWPDGVPGTLVEAGRPAVRVLLAALGITALVVAAMVGAHRTLEQQARRERLHRWEREADG